MCTVSPSFKNKFKLCLNDEELSDCVFVVGKQKCSIKGHRLLFAISSPNFRAMCNNENKNVVIFKIEDVEAQEFQGMKQFIYTDEVEFTSSLYACSLYLAAKQYGLPELASKCVQYIKDNISVPEVIEVYEFSYRNNIPDVEEHCSKIFQYKTKAIMESEKFLLADFHTIEKILKLDSMSLKSEFEVFTFIEKWALAKAAIDNISLQQFSEHFNSIIRHIRFLTMSHNEYGIGPSKSSLLTAEEKMSIAHILLGYKEVKWPESLCEIKENRKFIKNHSTSNVQENELYGTRISPITLPQSSLPQLSMAQYNDVDEWGYITQRSMIQQSNNSQQNTYIYKRVYEGKFIFCLGQFGTAKIFVFCGIQWNIEMIRFTSSSNSSNQNNGFTLRLKKNGGVRIHETIRSSARIEIHNMMCNDTIEVVSNITNKTEYIFPFFAENTNANYQNTIQYGHYGQSQREAEKPMVTLNLSLIELSAN